MPIPVTSSMSLMNGNRPVIDADGFITNIAYKRPVVNVTTTTRLVTVAESGTYFTTYGAAGSCNFTLPDVVLAIGCEYWFSDAGVIGASGFTMTITGTPADIMVTDADIDADTAALATASKMVGNTFHVWSNGTYWFTAVEVGKVVAGGVIVTVAS
jgi:hypothetical protein